MTVTVSFCMFTCLVAFAEEPTNLLKPTNKVESWRWEEHEGGKGTIKAEGDAIVFHVTKVTGTDWHVQAVQADLDLKEGQEYTLTFKAKCDASCVAGVNAMIDQEDWHPIGLGEQVTLGKEYREFKYPFRADGVAPRKNRITLVLGIQTGTVSVKDMVLTEKSP
jgi:hypothetical protein